MQESFCKGSAFVETTSVGQGRNSGKRIALGYKRLIRVRENTSGVQVFKWAGTLAPPICKKKKEPALAVIVKT